MDETTRLHYLQVMGVETWQLKSQSSSNNVAKEDLSIIANVPKKIVAPTFNTQVETDDNWTLLAKEVNACQKCELYKTRKKTVFGSGNLNADWLFIGENNLGKSRQKEGHDFYRLIQSSIFPPANPLFLPVSFSFSLIN